MSPLVVSSESPELSHKYFWVLEQFLFCQVFGSFTPFSFLYYTQSLQSQLHFTYGCNKHRHEKQTNKQTKKKEQNKQQQTNEQTNQRPMWIQILVTFYLISLTCCSTTCWPWWRSWCTFITRTEVFIFLFWVRFPRIFTLTLFLRWTRWWWWLVFPWSSLFHVCNDQKCQYFSCKYSPICIY